MFSYYTSMVKATSTHTNIAPTVISHTGRKEVIAIETIALTIALLLVIHRMTR